MKIRSDSRELDKVYKRRDRYEIPDWQRDEVWDLPRRQKLIDSVLRGWRLPKFYFVVTGPQTYEVVDGQQRLATIFEFLSGELTLSDESANEFGGATYSELPADISDKVDDFEIDFDEISDASDADLMEFFQRLQNGLQLNSSEKLNAVPSKLKTFCKKSSQHKFFKECVAFSDKRYAHFDVMAKVATLEAEGLGAGLRYQDVKRIFESNANFSEQSQVAKRIRVALDLLGGSIPSGSKTFRSRSITQSLITMICNLQQSVDLKSKGKLIGEFAKDFVESLASEVEKGRDATDVDLIAFQKSVNANVKGGPVVRHQVLLRKLFQFAPDIMDVVDAKAIAAANYHGEILALAKSIRSDISSINDAHSAASGSDLFKATNKTAAAQALIGETATSFESYQSLIDALYFLLWEGPGSKLTDKPESFKDVNSLRTELQHDTDHGDDKSIAKKKIKNGSVFNKYAGVGSPSIAAPHRFPVLHLNILKSIRADLQLLLSTYS